MTLLRGHFPLRRRFTLSLEKKKCWGRKSDERSVIVSCVVWSPHPRYSGRNGWGGTAAADEGGENVVDQFRRLCVSTFFFSFQPAPTHTHTERESSSCSNRTLPIFFLCPFFLERFRVKKKTKLTLSDCFDSPPSSSIGYTRERQMKDVTVFNAVRWTFEPRFL